MTQVELLRHVLDALERLRVPYMLVGSFASYAYGEPRFTQDIDLVVGLAQTDVVAFCDSFPPPDFYVSEPAVRDAVRTHFQFNVLHTPSGNKLDFILPRADEWGRSQLSRRRRVRILPDREADTASPEDVILGKMLYYQEGGSEKHLRDIAGILRVSGPSVDRDHIAGWADRLGFDAIWKMILEAEAKSA